jgi:hypothetical protein
MPPRQRKAKSTTPVQSDERAASKSGQMKKRERRRSIRRSGPPQDDESDERLSVALTIATMADIFKGKEGIHSNGNSNEDGNRLLDECKSSKLYINSNISASVDANAGSKDERILPQLRRPPSMLDTGNKSSNSMSASNKIAGNSIAISDAPRLNVLPAVGHTVTAHQKDVANVGGGRKQAKKTNKATGLRKAPSTSTIAVGNATTSAGVVASSTSCSVSIVNNILPEVSTLPVQPPLQTLPLLEVAAATASGLVPVLVTPVIMPDGSIRLLPFADGAIRVVPNIVAPASNNPVSSGEILQANQLQVVAEAALKTEGAGGDKTVAEPRRNQSVDSVSEVGSSAGEGARPGLGSLSSLRNFYCQPKTAPTLRQNSTAEAGDGVANGADASRVGSPAITANDVSEGVSAAAKSLNGEKTSGSSALTSSEGTPVESGAPSASNLGVLKTLREYYSGIEKKDQTPDRNRYSSPGKVTNAVSTETAVPTLQPAISSEAMFVIQAADGLVPASVSVSTSRLVGSSTGRILPEPRSASYRNVPATSALTALSNTSVATGVVSSVVPMSREDAASRKRSSAEDDQPLPPQKRRKLSKSDKSPDRSTDAVDEETDGAESCDDEAGGELTVVVENGHAADNTDPNTATCVNGIVLQSK